VPTFLKTLVTLEEAFIAAYIAAAQELAILGQGRLVQVALQIGAVEDIARTHIVERLLQARPVAATAAGGVGDDACAPRRSEGVLLQIEELLEGGDAGIADGGGHILVVSKTSAKGKRRDVDSETALMTR
jgi:hypothetical protein